VDISAAALWAGNHFSNGPQKGHVLAWAVVAILRQLSEKSGQFGDLLIQLLPE
jgi:hypothetical protein